MICIGIDIAKRSHVASAVDEDGGTVVESFKFDNTANGFAKMLKRLRKADATPENSLVGMEATGRYWVALFDFLISHGYEAAVINPIQTDAFRGVWTVRKVKTDALDAAMIADLVRYKRYEPSALGDEATEELRNLARYRLSLVERSTALKNRATAILDRTFPELAGLFSNAYCPTHRELLQHCATPDQVLGTDVGTLERILREASRGRCGRAKAEIGDPNAFDDPHRLMGYAGMDPTRSESGETVRSDGHMSKRGPGALRWAFMQAADCARKNDPYFGDYYDRKRGVDGKHHYVALSGVARKLMGVALAVMKEGRPYEPAPPRNHRPGHLKEA